MAVRHPFTGDDRAGLTRVARFALTGKRIPEEYAEESRRWSFMIDLFMLCFDQNAGAMRHLPEPGGVLAQGYSTMKAFGVLEVVWFEERKKAIAKGVRRDKTRSGR